MKRREMSEVSRRDETETLVARYEPKSDGQPVEIYCTATPACFYILKALAGMNSIGEPIAPFKVATGSGREMLNLVTQMGEAIAAGMLGWCSLDPVVAARGSVSGRTHLDMFSGTGGFALVAQRTGWETIGFAEMDAYGKANALTVVFAPWHPNPEYRIFKTGSLLSRNEEYPSGLVIVNERGVPQPWQAPNH